MNEEKRPEFVTVEASAGLLRGRRMGEGGVFQGVPYAAPPVGPLRWRSPEPALPIRLP